MIYDPIFEHRMYVQCPGYHLYPAMLCGELKTKDYSYLFFSAPIKGGAQCYASLHSIFHEYL